LTAHARNTIILAIGEGGVGDASSVETGLDEILGRQRGVMGSSASMIARPRVSVGGFTAQGHGG
jgi:hypothetical protein